MQSDQDFIASLQRSDTVVRNTADLFRSHGKTVVLPPLFIRPEFEDREAYRDGGDLYLLHLVEVKHRPSLTFTGAHDYPFKTVFVDRVNKFSSKPQKPFGYIIWNAEETAALWVNVSETFPEWTTRMVTDKVDNLTREVYECPLHLCKTITK